MYIKVQELLAKFQNVLKRVWWMAAGPPVNV